MERSNKIKELEKQLEKEKRLIKEEKLLDIYKKTGLKIGDEIEFIHENRDGYNSTFEYSVSTIDDISQFYGGEIYIFTSNNVQKNIKDVTLFDKNDWQKRHDFYYNGSLEVGENFKLIIDKLNSTKGKVYQVYKIIKERGKENEYWYYNDHNEPEIVYEGEFHIKEEFSG